MVSLVTGATGFVGSHVAERLVASGAPVRALVRTTSDVRHLRGLGVELVQGSLEDAASLDRACRDVGVVYHNAALVGDWGREADFVEVDVHGTARIVEAAVGAGATRFVHMSSASVYGFFRIRNRHVTEALPLDPRPWRWDYYARAKAAAERVVGRADAGGRIETAILRPSVVYGPRDRAVLPRLVGLLRQRKLRIIGSGQNRPHLVYAGDVAEAAVRAGTRPQARGGVYNLDGRRDCTQQAFFEAVADLSGEPPPTRRLPLEAAFVLALLSEAGGHLSRREAPPALTRYLVILAAGETDFDLSRAGRELGWEPRTPFEQGFRLTRESHARGAQGLAA